MKSSHLHRYISALELHAALAQRSQLPEDELNTLRLATEALKKNVATLGNVKTEAVDMAKKLDSWEEVTRPAAEY